MQVSFGVIGAGGFAAGMSELILTSGQKIQPAVNLLAVAEPDQKTHADRLAELRQRGVATYSSIDEVLARSDVEAVWLPLPIGLHRSFTERALAAGKAVICEKPVAGSVQDVDAMIKARDAAGLPVAIGYQSAYEPATKTLKEQLRNGVIGDIQSLTLSACWSRPEAYYQRANWVGRIQQNGVWILDSPPNNALAHYVHLPLFLLDATPVSIEAELYRVWPIENYDTISMRVQLKCGSKNVSMLALLTHACHTNFGPRIVITGTKGSVEWTPTETNITVDGKRTAMERQIHHPSHILERVARLFKGIPDDTRLVAQLEDGRRQTVVVNGASEASVIRDVPSEHYEVIEKEGFVYRGIRGINAAFDTCVSRNVMLHESGLLPFTQPPGKANLVGYSHFKGPKR